MTLFDLLNSISHTKVDLSTEDDFEKVYNPFMINRYLSMDVTTATFTTFMNRYPNIPRKEQYKFYLHSIPKKKRFFKYSKKTVDDGCRYIMEYFECGYDEALKIKELLSPQEINNISELYKDK